jgi:hypothetical protein
LRQVIQTGTIRLPSQLGNYQSEMELQQRVQAFIHKYVDVPPDIEKLASYYVMLTWLFDKFYVLPYCGPGVTATAVRAALPRWSANCVCAPCL